MDTEIDYVIKLSLEIMLCALIITFCGILGKMSNEAYNKKVQYDSTTHLLEDLSDLYYYNNRMVSSSEVIELMMTQTTNYKYTFVDAVNGTSKQFSRDINAYNQRYLQEFLSKYTTDTGKVFKSELVVNMKNNNNNSDWMIMNYGVSEVVFTLLP